MMKNKSKLEVASHKRAFKEGLKYQHCKHNKIVQQSKKAVQVIVTEKLLFFCTQL